MVLNDCGIPLSCLPVVSSSFDSVLVPVDGLQLAAGGVFRIGKNLGHFLKVVELHGNGAEGFEGNLVGPLKSFYSRCRYACSLCKSSSAVSSLQSPILAVFGHHFHQPFRRPRINIQSVSPQAQLCTYTPTPFRPLKGCCGKSAVTFQTPHQPSIPECIRDMPRQYQSA